MIYKRVSFKTITILAVMVWTSSLFNPAIADEPTLRQLNDLYDHALVEADGKVLDRLYSEDFKYISFQGEVRNKKEQIDSGSTCFLVKAIKWKYAYTEKFRS